MLMEAKIIKKNINPLSWRYSFVKQRLKICSRKIANINFIASCWQFPIM